MQEASAKGKSAQFKGRSDAVAPDRPRTWPEGRRSGNGESPQPWRLSEGKGTRPRRKRRRGGDTSEGSGRKDGRESQPERKPDAGASAGDKSLAGRSQDRSARG